MAALRKEMLGMRLLKIAAADFLARNLSGDGQHRNTAAMAIVEPVDQMQVSWPATSGANRQFAREMGLCAGGECGCFFVPHMNPANLFSSANRVRDPVEGVAAHTISSLDSCLQQDIYKQISYSLCHIDSFSGPNSCMLEPGSTLHAFLQWAAPLHRSLL